jgi:DNA replication ATP-dependent helicase Dna2
MFKLIFSVIFSKRRFDYCIVDEASQLTLPHCIGPLQYANTFVLVGDHYQLSPLVRNAEALKGGMAESLFKTLSEAHPQSVIDLRYQYRMNSDIMNLSNTLIYGNRLICANQTVSESSFSCCHSSGSTKMIQGPLSERILSKIIDPMYVIELTP